MLLQVENLSISFGKDAPIIQNVSFGVERGQTLAIVGESGSGKTICCRALLDILPGSARIDTGTARFRGLGLDIDLLNLSNKAMRSIRGDRISMIFQEPMRSLSPLHRVGHQVAEVLCLHRGLPWREARRTVKDQFSRVGFKDIQRAWNAYPFEMSGGMRQRAMIAMAIIAKPDVLIADEPTTALDVTTQAHILGLIKDLREETGMSVIFVTHDLGVVANIADSVCVMRRGRVMESGPVDTVIKKPDHGYTRKLLAAAPVIPHEAMPNDVQLAEDPILRLDSVHKTFIIKTGQFFGRVREFRAVEDVSFAIPRGKTFAIVGESGSGKSTVANMVLGALRADEGSKIRYWPKRGGEPLDVQTLTGKSRRRFQGSAQMVFQDPFSSLSPRMQILDILTEPLAIHGIGTRKERREKAAALIERVGLDPGMLRRFPHAFSGGQRQRLSIARALMLEPDLLVCDEPTSALDLSVQAQVLNLLEEIRDNLGLSYLFISHDLAVVARVADECAVMHQGLIVEMAAPDVLFTQPKHPYTKALIAACLEADVDRKVNLATISMGAGDPHSWPSEYAMCGTSLPALVETVPGHMVRIQT
ncbi:MAG: ABC transporter ATP-binding protein [Rhodobacteraceae bacterium]|nr:ABC transporter ATP-binding protein [Paracoccaceae bacterium]